MKKIIFGTILGLTLGMAGSVLGMRVGSINTNSGTTPALEATPQVQENETQEPEIIQSPAQKDQATEENLSPTELRFRSIETRLNKLEAKE